MRILITKYQPQYHDKVVQIITTIQQKEFNLPITYEDQPDLAFIDDFYDAFLVALYDDILVGTIGFKQIDDFAVIRKMFVQQEFRGKMYGFAQKLLESIENEITKINLSKVYLGTTEFFKAAHKFYEKNHYTEISKTKLPPNFPVMTVDTKFYFKELNNQGYASYC